MSERCRQYDEQISAFLDGELSEAEASELRAHMAVCPDCAVLCDLLGGLSIAVRDDLAEPPAALSAGVMGRIYAWEESCAAGAGLNPDAPAPIPISRARETEDTRIQSFSSAARKAKKSHLGRNLVAAACLLLVIGAGVYLGMDRFWNSYAGGNGETLESAPLVAAKKSDAEAAPEEQTTLGDGELFTVPEPEEEIRTFAAGAADTAQAENALRTLMEEPMEQPAAADMEEPADEPAEMITESAPFDYAPAPMAEPAPMDDMEPAYDTAETEESEEDAEPVVHGTVGFTRTTYASARDDWDPEEPVNVPAGREEDFENLLHASGAIERVDEDRLTLIATVEYRGVNYEFFVDESGELLLWKDAAESVHPQPAAGTEEDLWDIIG